MYEKAAVWIMLVQLHWKMGGPKKGLLNISCADLKCWHESPALAPHIVVIPEIIPGDMTQISSFVYHICHKRMEAFPSFPSQGFSDCDSALRFHQMIDRLIAIFATTTSDSRPPPPPGRSV